MRHEIPDGYKVSSFCRGCGRDFVGDSYFENHLVGTHDYTYAQGLQFDPPVEDGRRCKTDEELHEVGMRVMTKNEMLASKRHNHRADYGIEMWFNPSEIERTRDTLAALKDR